MIDNSKCPYCKSSDIEDTSYCSITPNEITQDFQCFDCKGIWEVIYSPVLVKEVVNPKKKVY